MQKVFVIAAILMIAAPGNAREIKTSPIDRAIKAWIHANNIVQNAIDYEVCWGKDASEKPAINCREKTQLNMMQSLSDCSTPMQLQTERMLSMRRCVRLFAMRSNRQ